MTDLEARLRAHAAAVLAGVAPVTVEELGPRRRPRRLAVRSLAIAAALIALAGVAAAIALDRREPADTVTAGRSAFPRTLDGQRDWQLAVLNGDVLASDQELQARFTADFLAAVPPDKFRAEYRPLVAMGPWRALAEVERRGDEVLAVQLLAANGQQARLTVHRTPDGRVDGSTILAAAPCADLLPAGSSFDPALQGPLAWINELLASSRLPADDELRQHLAPSFLAEISADRFRAGLPQLRALGPYSVRSFEGPPQPRSFTQRVGVRTGEEAQLQLAIENDVPHRITGFSIFTKQPCQLPSKDGS